MPSIFTQNAARTKSAQKLESGDDVEAGTEILRLAKKVGKGWFALLLAETLEVDTVIPRYILKAIAFSSTHNISKSILRKMILFRMEDNLFAPELSKAVKKDADVDTLPAKDLVQKFVEIAPHDPVTELVKLTAKYE